MGKNKKKRDGRKVERISEEDVRRILAGDEAALKKMMDHYTGLVRYMCQDYSRRYGCFLSREEVEDVIQIVFSKLVIERLSKFTGLD